MPVIWMTPDAMESQDAVLERDLATAMRRKLDRLAKAQALAWNNLEREEQQAYLAMVDRLEAK